MGCKPQSLFIGSKIEELKKKIGETGLCEVKRVWYEKRLQDLMEQQKKLESAGVAKPTIKKVSGEDLLESWDQIMFDTQPVYADICKVACESVLVKDTKGKTALLFNDDQLVDRAANRFIARRILPLLNYLPINETTQCHHLKIFFLNEQGTSAGNMLQPKRAMHKLCAKSCARQHSAMSSRTTSRPKTAF